MDYTELFLEKTYTENEIKAIFRAIYEGKIDRVWIDDISRELVFNIAPVVFCGDCDYCRHDRYCEQHHLAERDPKWFCKDGKTSKVPIGRRNIDA